MRLVSGDRESEVRSLADQVGITEIYAEKTPEDKLAIVRDETDQAKTLYVGDGINDAPAMMTATVGMAIGQNSDVTAEAGAIPLVALEAVKVVRHTWSRRPSTKHAGSTIPYGIDIPAECMDLPDT